MWVFNHTFHVYKMIYSFLYIFLLIVSIIHYSSDYSMNSEQNFILSAEISQFEFSSQMNNFIFLQNTKTNQNPSQKAINYANNFQQQNELFYSDEDGFALQQNNINNDLSGEMIKKQQQNQTEQGLKRQRKKKINVFLKRNFGWAKTADSDVVIPKLKEKNLSVICIIGPNGMVKWEFYEGCFDQTILTRIFENLTKLMVRVKDLKNVLIMNQPNIDNKDECFSSLKQANCEILYLPQFSPMLNPIQRWFFQLKSKIRTKKWSSKQQLHQATKQILQSCQSGDVLKYYSKLDDFIQIGLNRGKM